MIGTPRLRRAAALTAAVLLALAACSPDPEPPDLVRATDEPAEATGETAPGETVTNETVTRETVTRETAVGTSIPSDTGIEPEGFTTITARITESDGEVCEVCVWLADTSDERARGLMGVTALGAAAGMVFRFEEPTTGSFYMLQTPTPLSIAWFAPDGEHIGSTDMEPCLDRPAGDCPLFSPGAEYELALEVFQGELPSLGVGPGARLELLDGTESDRCPR